MAKVEADITLERRARAWQLRVQGWTYDQIGRELGVTGQSVYRYIRSVSKELQAQTVELAEQERQVDLARIDALLKEIDFKAAHDVKWCEAYLKALDFRTRLLGTYAPTKSETKGETTVHIPKLQVNLAHVPTEGPAE